MRTKFKEGRLLSAYSATQAQAPNRPLPIIAIAGLAHTPRDASRIADHASEVLKAYVAQDQASASPRQKVFLQTLSEPTNPVVVQGPHPDSSNRPLPERADRTLGLAFILENLRPRSGASTVREVEPAQGPGNGEEGRSALASQGFDPSENGGGAPGEAPAERRSARHGSE